MTEIAIALLTLTVLEVVLGVDNIIFISILSGKLPATQQLKARRAGLIAAMGMRIVLLMSIAWIIRLTAPLFTIVGHDISGRDLILIGGGLFLLGKATIEIHDRLEGEEAPRPARVAPSFGSVIVQVDRRSGSTRTSPVERSRYLPGAASSNAPGSGGSQNSSSDPVRSIPIP